MTFDNMYSEQTRTGTHACMINMQLGIECELCIGKMTPGSTGCTKCIRFRGESHFLVTSVSIHHHTVFHDRLLTIEVLQ